jgi:hypothetical protein
MSTRKPTARTAAAQAAPPTTAPTRNGPQDAPERAQAAPEPAALITAPTPRTRTRRAPGQPRNYSAEKRTLEQAIADSGPDSFPWPFPAPLHGVQGFSKYAGWAQSEIMGGAHSAEEILGSSADALLILITQAKYLGKCRIVQNAQIAHHDEFGNFFLRCIEHPLGGYLLGIIDDAGATYGGIEWFETIDETANAWDDWREILAK